MIPYIIIGLADYNVPYPPFMAFALTTTIITSYDNHIHFLRHIYASYGTYSPSTAHTPLVATIFSFHDTYSSFTACIWLSRQPYYSLIVCIHLLRHILVFRWHIPACYGIYSPFIHTRLPRHIFSFYDTVASYDTYPPPTSRHIPAFCNIYPSFTAHNPSLTTNSSPTAHIHLPRHRSTFYDTYFPPVAHIRLLRHISASYNPRLPSTTHIHLLPYKFTPSGRYCLSLCHTLALIWHIINKSTNTL